MKGLPEKSEIIERAEQSEAVLKPPYRFKNYIIVYRLKFIDQRGFPVSRTLCETEFGESVKDALAKFTVHIQDRIEKERRAGCTDVTYELDKIGLALG